MIGVLSGDDVFEVGGGVFLTTVGEPALAIPGLSGNFAPLSVGDSAPEFATVVLVTLSLSVAFLTELVGLDDLEIIGGVLLTAVGEPARTFSGLSGNFAPLGVGNSAPELTSVLLMSVGSL